MRIDTRFQEASVRVQHGKERERQIANALAQQVGLNIVDASLDDDNEAKIDRWLIQEDGSRIALQIKYRETGEDLLFEVFDTFHDWDDPRNKIGRDVVQGDAQLYAVLKQDKHTIVMVPTSKAKEIIADLLGYVKQYGWTVDRYPSKTFRYFIAGQKVELKVQRDPRDQRPKMIAYIPAAVFEAEAQAQVYHVRLPKQWQKAA